MTYDIIFITGATYFDHPLCGIAILKKWLEKHNFKVGVIEKPMTNEDITKLGMPNLFFGVSTGPFDSMVCNYTPLKRKREDDEYSKYLGGIKDRAVIVYCNWIREKYKETKIVIGGTESSLRRFTHYDYWDNKLRKPILVDTRADILAYGNSEKQILEIANKIKNNEELINILGTCIISKTIPQDFIPLPSNEEVSESKEKFCDMQNLISNSKNIYQQIGERYIIQYKYPIYTSKDLDDYYSLDFSRTVPKELRGFQFSVTTHRGCIGNCNFCSVRLLQGDKIISRSVESILNEIKQISKHYNFRGKIDDLGGPSANMYGMDCSASITCNLNCIDCKKLDKSHKNIINLMKQSRDIKTIDKVYVRSGIRFDLCNEEYLKELNYHIAQTLRIAPEHVSKKVLELMNKDKGDLKEFQNLFSKICKDKKLAYYFITAHPGSTLNDAKLLGDYVSNLDNSESVQIFTPTPMSVSTCMYYTSMNPKNKEKIYVPYSYNEKKEQKRVIFE